MTVELRVHRENILNTLELIADGAGQREYQRQVPFVSVPAELFNQWDDFYYPDDDLFREAFSDLELIVLSTFDRVFNDVADAIAQELLPIDEFMKTEAWKTLSFAAREALSRIEKVGDVQA
ncbi:hypothetical protein EA187_17390 [Lujinxingia sediminis]|uniref:Uncharacterized protein n=1 Tax=Lujinxingia sediminis TaxID=2480984 RepID=A0ABY0CPK5_9DELT|nr:hypothetical protein [Lujinxingia sediminis]RVU42113.1 hypothetical protein EA187_17390 [Lujinxingia sediminis]